MLWRIRRWWDRVTWRETVAGHTARYWLRILRDPRRAAPARAILKRFPPSVETVELLRRSLADRDPAFRGEICRVLAGFAGGFDVAQAALVTATADDDVGVRVAAVGALAEFRWIDAPVAAALHRCLRDADEMVRAAAANVLLSRLPDNVPSSLVLTDCTQDSCSAVRHYAVRALAETGSS
jgi:HEAT repeat protein